MKKSILILFIMCLLIIYLPGNGTKYKSKNNISPKQLIKQHFVAWNDKKTDKLDHTMTKRSSNLSWNMENLDYVKLISIDEKDTSTVKNGYINNGRGKDKKLYGVKVFRVNYDIKFKNNNKGPIENGKHIRFYILIKENKESPWKIDSWGF